MASKKDKKMNNNLKLNSNLFIVCGAPGVGKTTVAKALANKINAEVLTSEFVIMELFNEISNQGKDKDFSRYELSLGYKAMNSIAKRLLLLGKSVVLDGVFRSYKQRREAFEVVKYLNKEHKLGIKTFIINAECPEHIIKRRINARLKLGIQPGGYNLHLNLKKQFKPIKGKHHIIETRRNIDEQLDNFIERNKIL